MDDTAEAIRAARAVEKRIRRHFGRNCPLCRQQRPRGFPTKLLGHYKCRVDGYIDPRPYLTFDQYLEILDG